MKIKKLLIFLFIICVMIATQPSFGMELITKELKPTHTISIKSGFVVHNIAFDKNETIANLLLSKNNQQYLRTYNLSTKAISIDQPIDKNNNKLNLFTQHNYSNNLSKNLEPYALHHANNTTTIWENATQKPLYTLSHCAPILCAHLNNSKTQLITASNNGNNNIVNIWRLKKTINFICGQDNVSIEDTNENQNILSQSEAIKNTFDALDGADLDGEIPLACVSNQKEFDNLFSFMKLIYENNRENIKTESNALPVNQLCSMIIQCSYYGISNQNINLTESICQAITNKYNQKTDLLLIKQLPSDLQNIIAQNRIKDCINYIDSNQKPLFSIQTSALDKSITINWNSKTIAIATSDSIKVWDLSTQQIKHNLVGHTGEISSIAISPDGNYLATVSWDEIAKIWDLNMGHIKYNLVGHTNSICSIAYSPDGNYLATGSWDNTAKIWDLSTGQVKYSLIGHTAYINLVIFSPDGNYLATASWDNTVKIWDLNTGHIKYTLVGHTSHITSVAFSSNNPTILATGSWDNTAKIWNLNTGQVKYNFVENTWHIGSVIFSPDDNYLATVSWDEIAKIWDLNTGKIKHTLNPIIAIAISPDSKNLITGSHDKTIKIWNLNTGQVKRTLVGHTLYIRSVTISPDGKNLATTSEDRTVKIWDLDGSAKQTFLNKLTIEQADFLAEKVYPVIQKDIIFKIIENSEEHKMWMTFLPEAQQYLKDYIQIAPYQ